MQYVKPLQFRFQSYNQRSAPPFDTCQLHLASDGGTAERLQGATNGVPMRHHYISLIKRYIQSAGVGYLWADETNMIGQCSEATAQGDDISQLQDQGRIGS